MAGGAVSLASEAGPALFTVHVNHAIHVSFDFHSRSNRKQCGIPYAAESRRDSHGRLTGFSGRNFFSASKAAWFNGVRRIFGSLFGSSMDGSHLRRITVSHLL